jgi:hypothetical protein
MKKAAHETTGDDRLEKPVEMVGWGVEEADERYKKDASKLNALRDFLHDPFIASAGLLKLNLRSCNAVGISIRYPQVLHFHPGSYRSSGNTEGSEDSARLGLGYWEADYEGGKSFEARCTSPKAKEEVNIESNGLYKCIISSR